MNRARLVLETLEDRLVLDGNPIVQENLLPGNPKSEWDIIGAGDDSIQGYAAELSVDQGQTVHFKILTDATDYRLDIYRMGYYGGMGARKVATIQPSASLPQLQPDPIIDPEIGLVDAGNWNVSASWNVPANATSGIYFAKLVREDATPGASHIVFVVRDDDGQSDLLFQTSDTTWQAYNNWGGPNLYGDSRAYAVSYNRPFSTRGIAGGGGETNWVFWAEYPMVRWMESNGYNVSYATNIDTAQRGAEILEHRAFLSVGHDEYWSKEMWNNVVAARDAGVNLAFFSGNEVYWKVRWEDSIDGNGTPYRTMVCYKESKAPYDFDPHPTEWTGLWRDERFSPPADGGTPENALMGTIFTVNRGPGGDFGTPIQVPATFGDLRFWRNTSIANLQPGEVAFLANGTLGYEWDEELDNGSRPAGLIRMSSTTETVPEKMLDQYGNVWGQASATHNLTLYRAASGALVFGAGTVQWSFGLDGNHDGQPSIPDLRMQQATVNLFADMSVQPGSIRPGLLIASASTDTTPPTSVITYPTNTLVVQSGSTPITITGTAADAGGGVVGGVEVSTDGGLTWHRAEGRSNWSYVWTPSGNGQVTLKSRAADDSARLETPSAGITVTVSPDSTTPPQISNIATAGVSNQSVTVSWGTDEGATSRVEYGTSPANLSGNSHSSTLVQAHSQTLTNLAQNTTYYFTVSSTDEYGNTSTSAVLSFTTPAFLDTTAADFALGTLTNTVISQIANGEVTLAPTISADFSGTTLPTGWTSAPWASGGSANVGGGTVTINGARVNTNTFYGSGRSLEFNATFSGAPYQSIGLGNDFNDAPWAMFSTGSAGGALMVRTRPAGAGSSTDTPIPGTWLNAAHNFRIDWGSTSVTYFIDGVQVASHAVAMTSAMRPVASDALVDGQNLIVDWMRLSPFLAMGSYASRVFDGGTAVRWIPSWNGVLPSGTGLQFSVRIGNSPTPDSSWTNFTPLAFSGTTLGGAARYLQYQVDLTTANPHSTPSLPEVSISYSNAPDTVPPSILTRTPAPDAAQVDPFTVISVSFGELINSASINTSTVRLRPLDGSEDVPATVNLSGSTALLSPASGLAGNRVYRVTVSANVADASGNPLGSDQTWTFTTGPRQVVDSTSAEFQLGSTVGGTYLTQTGDGEVVLAPLAGSEFSGTSLPSGWASVAWNAGGSSTVTGGSVVVEGAILRTTTNSGPGRSLEFVATFTGAPYQHVGFADFDNPAWAIFSTSSGGALYARTNEGGSTDTLIPGSWLFGPHLFRIERNSNGVAYFIDGNQVASHAQNQSRSLPVMASDYLVDGGFISVDWMRLGPYVSPGTFQSRIFDAGQLVGWNSATWTGNTPSGTTLGLSVRMGNSSTPDATWTDFVPLSNSGVVVGGSSRYLQYQATLTSNSAGQTPTLNDVNITYIIPPGPGDPPVSIDTVRPTIIGKIPADGAVDVDASAPVTIKFSELMDPATINGSSIRLRAVGSTNDVTASVTFSGSTAVLTPTSTLQGNRTYEVTITSDVADLTGNTLLDPATWTFTTLATSVADTSAADFSLGSGIGTYLALTSDGALTLTPAIGAEFDGTTLPSGWTSTAWNAGGSSTVTGGSVVVEGAILRTTTNTGPGRTLEFVATYSGAPYQHVGFADFDNPAWAMFSTSLGGALYARTNEAGSTDTLIPGSWLDAPHLFRIERTTNGVTYFIDGNQVASHVISQTRSLPVMASDYFVDGGSISVDWVRVTPFVSSGTFTSRVFDAGQAVAWAAANWQAITPNGTAVSLNIRMGNTAAPDASWTDFVPFSNGATIGGVSRYIQYRADLSTTNNNSTPTLESVALTYSIDADTVAPRLVNQTPGSGAASVDLYAGVILKFGELMNATTIHTGTFRLRADGTTTDVLATVTYTGSTATLQPSAPLVGNTVYTVTVSGDIADQTGNTLANGMNLLSWSFTTDGGQFVQTTSAQFGTGTNSGSAIAELAGGEVQLADQFADAFSNTSLDAGKWTVQAFTTPSVVVADGSVSVAGAALWSTQAFDNTPVEGRVAFGAAPYQYFGLSTSFDSFAGNYWAAFSTGGTTDSLLARVNVSGATNEVYLGPLPSGFHVYRVQPGSNGFEFFVDGELRTTISSSFPIGAAPKIVLSAYNGAPQAGIQSDWARFVRYGTAGTHTSAIFDANTLVNWMQVDWTANLPSGTNLVIEARTTNTLGSGTDLVIVGSDQNVLPGTYGSNDWSSWVSLSDGADLSSLLAASRYLQYRLLFSSSDVSSSAEVTDIAFTWA